MLLWLDRRHAKQNRNWNENFKELPFSTGTIVLYHNYSPSGEQPEQGTFTGDPLYSRALAHSRAPLFTQPCSHCSHSRAPGEQWARLCVFTLHGCVQAARLCRGSPVTLTIGRIRSCDSCYTGQFRQCEHRCRAPLEEPADVSSQLADKSTPQVYGE